MRGRPTEAGPGAKAKEGAHSLFRRWMQLGLTGRMFLLVVIAVLPALVIQAVNEYALRPRARTTSASASSRSPNSSARRSGDPRGASQLLIALGELAEVQKRDSQRVRRDLRQAENAVRILCAIGAADAPAMSSARAARKSSVGRRDEFFKRAISATAWPSAITGSIRSPAKDDPFRAALRRIERQVAGVVFAGLDLKWLAEHLKERGLSPRLDPDRRPARQHHRPAAERRRLVGKNMRKAHAEIMDGDTAGWEEAKGVDGVARIFGYVPAQLPPRISSSAPVRQRPRRSRRSTRHQARHRADRARPFAAMYLAWVGGRHLSRGRSPTCWSDTGRVGQGQLRCPRQGPRPASEFGRLGQAFNEMADALAARHAAQQRAEEKLRHLNATLEVAHRAPHPRIGGSQPRQVTVPGKDEPRDPHPGERRARHAGAGQADQARRAQQRYSKPRAARPRHCSGSSTASSTFRRSRPARSSSSSPSICATSSKR